jgi:hypothetical protein
VSGLAKVIMNVESKWIKLYIQTKREIQNNLDQEEHTTRSPHIYIIYL